MPVSKLKNLAILILLLANAALLCLLIPRQFDRHDQQQELNASLSRLCQDQNVSLDPSCIDDTANLYALDLTDSETAQLEALTALLGEAPQMDGTQISGSSISRTGTWDGGMLSVDLQGQKDVSDLRSGAKRALKKMGFQLCAMDETVRVSPGIYTIRAYQSVLGVPVFSQGLQLTYGNNALTALEGAFFSGTPTRSDDVLCCSAAEAVVAFLGARVELGWVGSAITALEQGYLPTQNAMSGLRLIPTWKLTTDTGSFYINGLTHAVTEVS